MTPQVSVILPTYNRMATLPRAVASVLAQDMGDFELIVVDDGSTDDTAAWLKSQTDPRLRTISPGRNQGVSVARNLGLEAAQAPVVAFLDSDDIYRTNRLSLPLRAFDAEPDLVFTLSSAHKQTPAGGHVATLPDVKLAGASLEWALVCDLVGVETSSITARTQAARDAGGFCPVLSRTEDREFLIRLARHGAARFFSDVLWEKRWVDDSLSNRNRSAGRDLMAYAAQRPEFVGKFRKLGNYQATRVLVADLRRGDIATFIGNVRAFRKARLLQGSVAQIARDHRDVRAHRRAYNNSPALATLTGPPNNWL